MMQLNKFLDRCLESAHLKKARVPNWVALQMKFEKVLAARMLDSYNKKARKAIRRAGSMTEAGKSPQDITRSMTSQMKNIFDEDKQKILRKDIVKYYKDDRFLSAKEFKITVDVEDTITLKQEEDISTGFDEQDARIIDLVTIQNLAAAAGLYLLFAPQVKSIIDNIVGKKGLSRAAHKTIIINEIIFDFVKNDGEVKTKDAKPKNFRGTSKDYYTGLAQTTLNRTQIAGRLKLFDGGNFKSYEFAAIIDKRTSLICQSMHGRRFTVEQGQKNMSRVLNANSTAELKKVAGWRRDLSEFGASSPDSFKTGRGSKEFSDQLALAGLSIPPLHFRCRSTIRPI
jgi:hypothetical protein